MHVCLYATYGYIYIVHLISGCGRAFKQKSNLLQHISSVHENYKPFHCERCGKQFKSKYSCSEHEKKQRCRMIDQVMNQHYIMQQQAQEKDKEKDQQREAQVQ